MIRDVQPLSEFSLGQIARLGLRVEKDNYQLSDIDFSRLGLEGGISTQMLAQPSPSNRALAAVVYGEGIKRGCGASANNLALMMMKGRPNYYHSSEKDFECLGFQEGEVNQLIGLDNHLQAAPFFLWAVKQGYGMAASNLALMVEKQLYQPSMEDFKRWGLDKDFDQLRGGGGGGDPYAHASVFHRWGIKLGANDAVNNFAVMLEESSYQLIDMDVECLGLNVERLNQLMQNQPEGGARYVQAAALYRLALIKDKDLAQAATNLAELINSKAYMPCGEDVEVALSLAETPRSELSNAIAGNVTGAFFKDENMLTLINVLVRLDGSCLSGDLLALFVSNQDAIVEYLLRNPAKCNELGWKKLTANSSALGCIINHTRPFMGTGEVSDPGNTEASQKIIVAQAAWRRYQSSLVFSIRRGEFLDLKEVPGPGLKSSNVANVLGA